MSLVLIANKFNRFPIETNPLCQVINAMTFCGLISRLLVGTGRNFQTRTKTCMFTKCVKTSGFWSIEGMQFMEMGFCDFSPNQRTLWRSFFQAQNGNMNPPDTLFRSTIMFLIIPAGVIIQKKHTYWLNPLQWVHWILMLKKKKSIARVTHLLLVGIWIFLQISWVYIFFSLSENFDQFQPIISKLDRKMSSR